MCGYACVGCGRCGKPRSIPLPPVKCLACGALNSPTCDYCESCGRKFALPGESLRKAKTHERVEYKIASEKPLPISTSEFLLPKRGKDGEKNEGKNNKLGRGR